MGEENYRDPVKKLLRLGDVRKFKDVPNYLTYGLKAEHIPDLIRMAIDEDLLWADSETKEVWGPIHAWRALGQLKAEEAIEPLLGLVAPLDEEGDDWVGEEMPNIFGNIGPAAIPALERYVPDTSFTCSVRIIAVRSLESIARKHPGSRDSVVAFLTRQLEKLEGGEDGESINAFLILSLVELKAVESAPEIEMAFLGNCVDEMVMGDWDVVKEELGL